jgi:hypothetical protein
MAARPDSKSLDLPPLLHPQQKSLLEQLGERPSNIPAQPAVQLHQPDPSAAMCDPEAKMSAASAEQHSQPAAALAPLMEHIFPVTVTSMSFSNSRQSKSVAPMRVRLVCAHLPSSRRCAFVPLVDLVQLVIRPWGTPLRPEKAEQSYGRRQSHRLRTCE